MPRLVCGENVVALAGQRVRFVSAVDGSPVGKKRIDVESDRISGAFDAADRFVLLDGGEISAIDPASGATLHRTATPNAHRILFDGDRLFTYGRDELVCFHWRGAEPPERAWSRPLARAILHNVVIVGDEVFLGGMQPKERTVVLSLADGSERRAFPGSTMRADDRGLVLDVMSAFIVSDLAGKTIVRKAAKLFRPQALFREAIVANAPQANGTEGPLVVLVRGTCEVRTRIPEVAEAGSSTQKVVATAGESTFYVAEGTPRKSQPVTAWDLDGNRLWHVDVTVGGGHHNNRLEARNGRLYAHTGSHRVICLAEE